MYAEPAVSLKIMIVEDEVIIAMDLADMVSDLGHEVVIVANRVDVGVAYAQTGVLDLAILDMNLRGQMSFPIAVILRERGIPFIFASGYGTRGLIDGFQDAFVLTKPYSVTELKKMVQRTQPDATG